MKANMTRTTQWLLIVLMSALMTACGGGTKQGAVASATTQVTYQVQLSLTNNAGLDVTQAQPGQTMIVVVDVLRHQKTTSTSGHVISDTTKPATNTIVELETDGGQITPANSQLLTNGDGHAEGSLLAGDQAGAYTLKATVKADDGSGPAASVNYQVGSSVAARVTVNLRSANGQQIDAVQGGQVITVAAKVERSEKESNGQMLYHVAPKTPVTFGTDGGVFDPTGGKAVTDENGMATIRFKAKLESGGFRMAATAHIDGNDVTGTTGYSVQIPQVVLGTGFPFQAGQLDLSDTHIPAGGSVVVSGEIRGSDGNLFLTPVPITFTSQCAGQGGANFTATPVTTVQGHFQSTYTAGAGCVGQDQIEAQALLGGQELPTVAHALVNVDAPVASNLTYVSAEPDLIALKGRGNPSVPETSKVTFKVVSSGGIPVVGQPVNFGLTNQAGGISLQNTQAVSDAHGEVVATVQSGTVATSVRVTATIPGHNRGTQSDAIAIATGFPDQDSLSLSAQSLSLEAWNIDGVTDQLTIRAGDQFNNPAPDGTRVSFTASGGSVTPSCVLNGGFCTVTFTSQNPRPANGRIRILAHTVGEESFTDANGNGVYDKGEAFGDTAEPYRDDNENGRWDSGEYFVDGNNNGVHDGPNGLFDGTLCASGASCGSTNGIPIGTGITLVLATSDPRIVVIPGEISIPAGDAANVTIYVSDLHGNMMPAGTTIDIENTNGTWAGETSFKVGETNAPGPYVIASTIADDGTPSVGALTVTVTSPSGVTTTKTVRVADDGSTGDGGFSPGG